MDVVAIAAASAGAQARLRTLAEPPEPSNPNAWDISKAYYDAESARWTLDDTYNPTTFGVLLGVSEGSPGGIFFKPDGTKFYLTGVDQDRVHQISLAFPWSTYPAFSQDKFLSIQSIETACQDLHFSPDGTRCYVIGSGQDAVHQFQLGTAWDIGTMSFVRSLSIASEETAPNGLFFSPDGIYMYTTGSSGDDILQWTLSTAWNISTASLTRSRSIGGSGAGQDTLPQSLFFREDGELVFVLGSTRDRVMKFSLSTAWNISTMTFIEELHVAGQDSTPTGLFFDSTGSRFFIVGTSADKIHQYNIGGLQVITPSSQGEQLRFSSDGYHFYICEQAGDTIDQWTMTTPWDTSTATFVRDFSINPPEATPRGLCFKTDGTKMYVIGISSDSVHEFDLSIAWNISTASFVRSRSVSAQDSNPLSVWFKPDGTKLYIAGDTGNRVYEYNLSVAWDIGTMTYVNSLFTYSTATPNDAVLSDDGTKLYVVDSQEDAVRQYNLSTPWSVSTGTLGFKMQFNSSLPKSIFWKPNGNKFWYLCALANRVYTYTISPD